MLMGHLICLAFKLTLPLILVSVKLLFLWDYFGALKATLHNNSLLLEKTILNFFDRLRI